jgi:predicted metal-dependent hydrolase
MRKETALLQLDLPFAHTAHSLRALLEERLAKTVSLILTNNSTSVLSARVRAGILHIRLHRMFLTADSRVLNEIVSYLKGRKGAMPHFRGFIRGNHDQLGHKPPRQVQIKTSGKFHDLRTLYEEINQQYFDNTINAVITWGSRSPRYAVRNRTVGSYSEESNTIRINPVLDRRSVPRYYVAFIVYHEMLHAAQGKSVPGKRRIIHSREFKKKEKLFKEYERAMAWEG